MTILTLAEAKAALNITTSDLDDELADYLDAADDMIESRIGPVTPRTVVATVDRSRRLLDVLPVLSVQSVVGAVTGVVVAPTVVTVDPLSGVLTVTGWSWTGWPAESYTVTYTAGRDPIPPRVLQAARVLLQHLWQTQRSTGGGRGRGDTDAPATGYSMPNRVMELLAYDLKLPGIG